MLRSNTGTEDPGLQFLRLRKKRNNQQSGRRSAHPPRNPSSTARPLPCAGMPGARRSVCPSRWLAPALERYPRDWRAPMHLRRCGALICRACGALSPSPHREGCALPRFDSCRSRWFWLSPHGAIKCVACVAPADLGLVEAWVLARETGEGDDGYRIPAEILSLLRVGATA